MTKSRKWSEPKNKESPRQEIKMNIDEIYKGYVIDYFEHDGKISGSYYLNRITKTKVHHFVASSMPEATSNVHSIIDEIRNKQRIQHVKN